jgi:hypothetical protein
MNLYDKLLDKQVIKYTELSFIIFFLDYEKGS